jgi:hypothetical protein
MGLLASLPGSLLHPVLMSAIALGWGYAGLLGYNARLHRLTPSAACEPLLEGGRTFPVSASGRRHHVLSAALFSATVACTLLGMGNAYARAGRLFPGPHLYVAGGLLFVLSVNVSLAPHMKSDARARLCSYLSPLCRLPVHCLPPLTQT